MIAIGCDIAGYKLKLEILKYLKNENIPYIDVGCGEDGGGLDYPIIAKAVCLEITQDKAEKGILVCGTGIGMSIAANKIKGIRAAACSESYSVNYTRLHNDANVLCLGGRVIGLEYGVQLVNIFLNTEFEGGRHQRRVDMITELDNR